MSKHWLSMQVAAVLALPVPPGVLQIRDAADVLDRQVTAERQALLLVAAASLARDLQNERNALSAPSGRLHRQIDLLSQLQMAEQAPHALGTLFQMDHPATRRRRNGETTLILASEGPEHRHREDAPLIDVLRAAAADIEDCTRAVVRLDVPGVHLRAGAVHGITHMTAELIENTTKFLPADRRVRLSAQATDGRGVAMRVSHDGSVIGIKQLDALNVRLQSELPVDWVQPEHTGLYAVNSLVSLHGAHVYIDPTEQGTTIAVALPAARPVPAPPHPRPE
ncbi:ATP-binding protein (plasmid) [Streptomyces sp. QH1-20]|uniref:ATP-binding protein n=1 Tax=Streptomyces sp. QH1-20 TaxID=3240934 RepID=UPI0035123539